MASSPLDRRESLIEQAAHLIDEIDALARQIQFVHEDILRFSPLEDEPTIVEMYVLLGLYDRDVYLPALHAIVTEERPALASGDDRELLANGSWNEEPLEDVLTFVRAQREQVMEFLRSLPPEEWEREGRLEERNLSVYDVVYGMAQHDAELLRRVAMRLHDSRLSRG